MYIKILISAALLIVVVFLLVMLASQLVVNRLMFYPPHTYQDIPEILKLKTSDGKKISAIYLPYPEAKYTLLYSHGNAEDLGTLMPHLAALHKEGFSVFAYDYHGYGTSEGKPSEKNVYRDINAAYEYITQTLKVPPEHIILYGYSIGSGPSVHLAARKPVGGVILHSPLASVFRMLFKRGFLILDPFNNLSKIKQVKAPILILHGREDEIVPLWHSELLLKKMKTAGQHLFVEGAHHNDLITIAGFGYWETIHNFINSLSK